MKNEDIILGIVKENSAKLTDLNREVGEIKASLSSRRKEKAKGFTIIGLLISTGVLISKLFETIVSSI